MQNSSNHPKIPIMGQAPILGQRQQQVQAAVAQAVQGLAMGIYSRMASDYMQGARDAVDPEQLRELARDSQQAARAFFQAMGVEFEEEGQ